MHFLSAFVFLSAIMVTQAKDDISKDLNINPLSELLYIFDVTSDAPVKDVKGAFGTVVPRHSFKVIGENMYRFVVHEVDVEKLRQINFPAGSTVTQYPVQHSSNFFEMFGVTHVWEEKDDHTALGDGILLMGHTDIVIPMNTPTAVYASEMRKFGEQYVSTHDMINCLTYSGLSSYPPRIFFFMEVDENAIQNAFKDASDAFGGPGNRRTSLKHAIQI